MDFAALMKKELSKGKGSAPPGGDSKYIKRSDVEEKRKKAYLEEQARLEAEREAKATAKRKREEDAAAESKEREEKRQRLAEEMRIRREEKDAAEEASRRKRLGLPELKKATSEEAAELEDGMEDIPDDELRTKLRQLGEPTVLFGESHNARLRRHRKLTTVITKGPIPTTLQLVEQKDMKVDGAVPKEKDARKWLFRQLASYFTMVLTEYHRAMEAEKSDTTASKTAYAAMVQSRENMVPVCCQSFIARSIGSGHLVLTADSSSEDSRKATFPTTSSRPLSRSSRPPRSAATSTPTTATCACPSARRRGPSA